MENAAAAHLLAAEHIRPDRVSGRAYFITNGEPVPLWNFLRAGLQRLGIEVDEVLRDSVRYPVREGGRGGTILAFFIYREMYVCACVSVCPCLRKSVCV